MDIMERLEQRCSEEKDKLEEILHMIDELTYDDLIKLRGILIKEAGAKE